VIAFAVCEGRVIVRHYQTVPPLNPGRGEKDSLVEIGPRFALTPIRIMGGAFNGETLFNSET
jgi:ribosome biogenesis protein BRX1